MPHFPKPFFRPNRGVWYVQIAGKQHNLGSDKDQAFDLYHQLMRQRPKAAVVPAEAVAVLVDHFLEWVQKNRAHDTYEWYRQRLQKFCNAYPDLTAEALRPFHVQEWIDSMPVSTGTKRNYARAIQRVMRWAAEMGYVDRNPIAHFRKPKGGIRNIVISPEEFTTILSAVRNEQFRDLLTFAWETGARAAECLAVEKRHVDFRTARIIFPVDEEKMHRVPRIIYLNDAALAIVKRLCIRWPTGRLFRNTNGAAWTTESVNCAFVALRYRMGQLNLKRQECCPSNEEISAVAATLKKERVVRGHAIPKPTNELFAEARRKLIKQRAKKHASKFCLTTFRHSWCHRALRNGVDALTVATLLGHADPSMVAKVYSHLGHAPGYLKEAVEKATA